MTTPKAHTGYAPSHRVYELCGIAATTGTGAWLAARLCGGELHAWWLPVALGVGLLGADLVSGVVHWAFDTWGDLETPIVGRLAIRAFREHHRDATALLSHDFVETNGHNFALALTLTTGGLIALPARGASAGEQLAGLCALAMALCVALTSQVHKWAHMPRPPRLVRLLQRGRVILSPEHHARHHLAPHREHYCITTGWLDAPLRALRVFDALELAVARLTRAAPHRHAHARSRPIANA